MGAQKNRLAEMVLLRTQNIHFYEVIRNLVKFYDQNIYLFGHVTTQIHLHSSFDNPRLADND